MDLDFHTDENGNEAAKGLWYIARKAIEHGYEGRVVCGHCCSLAVQPQEELDKTLAAAREAGVTVVSLPLVNQWTQDRADGQGGCGSHRTPRWRGITTLHELRAAGVATAVASDNTRDQFYAYGDLDMLEVFTQAVRIGHLDRPYGDWPRCITSTPARAMRLPGHGVLRVGGPANMVVFRARRYSELLSRPQYNRTVIRAGVQIHASPPPYEELDYLPAERRYLHARVPSCEVARPNGLGAAMPAANGQCSSTDHGGAAKAAAAAVCCSCAAGCSCKCSSGSCGQRQEARDVCMSLLSGQSKLYWAALLGIPLLAVGLTRFLGPAGASRPSAS